MKKEHFWCIMDFWHEKPATDQGGLNFTDIERTFCRNQPFGQNWTLNTQCDVQNTREREMMRWKMGNSVDFQRQTKKSSK